ncbi:polysaccharide biosynthesis protein [Anditalea andensis]|uniref:Polysaccharide biosynthesis protein n=1 Tax=Anditalea andensis TaxID=1048983 RepID=A0A074L483_9BACT|nr:polysaccharide biosynthesis C-terminal domain-containing protein [Anditalea andensis]KEO74628.1 polysaccharide biosynthesis protein [Anditalea andensis]
MSQLKRLAGQTAVYGISSILGKSINFLLIPIYTGYLPKEDVGAFTHLYAFIAFFNIIFTYGMETAFFRFSTGKGLDPKKVYNSVQSLILTTSLTLGALIYLSAAPLSVWLEYGGQEHLFRWVAMILTIDALLAIPFAKLRVENQALKFALVKLANILLNVGFNIFFIVLLYHIANGDILTILQPWVATWYRPDWGVDYILLSNVLANALILPVLFYLTGKFSFTLDKSILKPMWHYAVPLLFMGLAGVTNEVFSRGLFEYSLPEDFYPGLSPREAGGIFGANFKLAILMNLIIQAFKYAAEPFFFQQSENKNNPAIFAKVMHWFIIFCSLLMVAVAVNLDIIGRLVLQGEGYGRGLVIVPLLLLGYLFLGIYFNLSIWFKITDQTKYSFYITTIGAVITVVVVITLVPVFGFMGAAMSTILSYMTMSIICYVIGQKHYPIPYQTGKAIIYLSLATAFSYAGFFLGFENVIVNFLFQNSLVVLFALIIYIIEKEELILIFKSLKK